MASFGKKEKAKNFDYYKKMIEEIIREWNLDPDSMYNPRYKSWSLVQGSADFYVTLFNLDGIDFIEVAGYVVKTPDGSNPAFYRRLLELNDYYIGVKLSVKDEKVWLLGQRECEGMDKGEAKRLIDNVRLMTDDIDDKLHNEFGAVK